MDKSALRKIYLEKRKSLSDAEWLERCAQIKDQLLAYFDFSNIKIIHCFLPITTKKEVDTWPIIQALQQQGISVAVSKVNWQAVSMEHYLLTPDTVLQDNQWSIPEPVAGETISSTKIDMILIPLLAFDLYGQRVGYGKGFYDRFLTQCASHAFKVGLSLEPPVAKISDINPYDIRLDFVVTPEKVWEFL